jgi:hypothetical protein
MARKRQSANARRTARSKATVDIRDKAGCPAFAGDAKVACGRIGALVNNT